MEPGQPADKPEDIDPAPLATPIRSDLAATDSPDELRRYGRYLLLGRLGSGGMGVVYAASGPTLDRKVALKLLRQGEGGNVGSVARSRLLREARALARLSHANVVHVYEVGTVGDGEVYIAMEHVEGQTLRDWQGAEKRSFRDVLARYLPAGRGLQAAHEGGLVHRDFKPENVILGDDGRVLVLDFGLAVAPEVSAAESDPVADPVPGGPSDTAASTAESKLSATLDEPSAHVASGSMPLDRYTVGVIGTRPYMAPEQRDGLPLDARTDQYSFCLALYEGLYGERPFAEVQHAPEGGPTVMMTEAGETPPPSPPLLMLQSARGPLR